MTDVSATPIVYSRDGAITGRRTGGTRRCGIEGCPGELVAVRWADGKLTWPCTAGMARRSDGNWRLI